MKEKEWETPPIVWVKMGTACHDNRKKSPENRANLPFTGAARLDEPQRGGMPAWFISHFYLRLGLVRQDDVSKERHSVEIRASGRETAGVMWQRGSCWTVP